MKKLSDLFEKGIREEEEARLDESRRGQSRRYLWMGNEPDIHYVYLFSLANRLDLSCKYMKWIRNTYFTPTPDGLPVNDDGGTLSAWYVFSAIGFYPIAGTNEYILGCPLFDRAVIELENGKKIEIIKKGETSDKAYLERVLINGVEIRGNKIYFNQIK